MSKTNPGRSRVFALILSTVAILTLSGVARAQEISDAHLKAARAAIAAIKATDEFDAVLPRAAAALKAELMQRDPNLQEVISQTVDNKTLEMAARRADLEKEAATAYARVFTEQQLNDIANFYNSETGQKLLSDGGIVMRELMKAADIWQRGVTRDLAQSVNEEMAKVAPQSAAGTPAVTPAPAQ